MRRNPNEVKSHGESGLARLGARASAMKRSRIRRLTLESLEERALMATSPISLVSNNAPITSNNNNAINDSNPFIAVDPVDPQKLVTVYTDRNANNGLFIRARAAASSNGGLTWTQLNLPQPLFDPTTTSSPALYPETDGMGVGFDRNGQVYVGVLEHNGGNSGAVVLEKFDFSGTTPSNTATEIVAYQWNQTITTPVDLSKQPSIVNFSLAVDSNLPTFRDPSTGAVQTDPTAGSVYIVWTANTPAPANPPNPYNPFTIQMVASRDGLTFPASGPSGPGTLLSGGNAGNQRYTAPQLAVSQGRAGTTGGQVTAIWDDFGSFATASPDPLDAIQSRTVTFDGTALSLGQTSFVAFTTVRGALSAPYPRASGVSPIGIGPGAQIAVDNTLGSFSANQGNLYVAYVDRSTATGNPNDNTDIYLATSTNGGLSWTTRAKVNDDLGSVDGYSGASGNTGRPQFEPSIAVDPSTGTLALSWLDARDDASNTRYATYLTTSIDGGQTFAKDTFANVPNTVTDAITGKPLVVGPMSDTGSVEGSLSFGSHQGLAISNGVIHPVWSGTTFFNVGASGRALGDGFNKQLLGIETSQATYVFGPRVISGTMGPVASQSVDGRTFNNTFTTNDHTQQVDGFSVTFDRPVDISSFTAADVKVIFRNTVTPIGTPGTTIALDPTNPIQALDSAFNGSEATTFFVKFASPQSAVGTYSYSVGPNITDKMWSPPQNIVVPSGPATSFNAVAPQVPQAIPDFNGTDGVINSTINVTGLPASSVLANVTVTLNITHTFDADLRIILISPNGRSVVLSNREGGSGDNFTNTTFDSNSSNAIAQGLAPFSATFAPDGSLAALIGGAANGIWTLQIRDQASLDTGSLNAWSIKVTPGAVGLGAVVGHSMDQNANGKQDTTGTTDVFSVPTPLGSTPFQAPYDTTTLPIIVPGPHLTSSFATFVDSANVSHPTTSSDNLALNGTVSSIDVTFDRNMDPTSFTAAQVLRMLGPTGPITGPFTVRADPQAGENASFPRTFRISFPTQQISGTYTLVFGAGIKSSRGDLVDTNQNAGVSLLFQKPTAATTNIVYGPQTPLTPTNGAISPNKTTTSTITINDTYLINKAQVGLSITYPHDPDLTAILTFTPADTTIAPVSVTLFSNVGNVGDISTQHDFINTSFSDDTTNPLIQNGSPPFTGRFTPQMPLSVLNGLAAKGTFTLTITTSAAAVTGTSQLTSFSLTLTKNSDTGIVTGLGEPVADQSEASFRIFTMDPTNPLSSNTWTAVGGAANNSGSNSGRIGGIAVDASDPSGNTVFVAGASGGVWKTTNFLTTDPNGPTYVPLTDAAATNGINIGSIAIFSRNNDPKQSIVVVSTGEGDSTSTGVGFLISRDGGASWTLLDSLKNYNPDGSQIPSSQRDHTFVGLTSFKVIVDPRSTPTGDIVIYAAMAGFHNGVDQGGIYRSLDSGKTWTRMRAGFATDVAFDPNSGRIDAFSNPTGNIRTIYGAFQGDGVYISPNQGQLWTLMAGGVGDPLIQNLNTTTGLFVPIPVNAPADTPNGGKGRLVIVHPALTGNAAQDLLYENWLYVAASAPDGHFNGLFMTKDNGQNWVKVRLANASPKAASGLTTSLVPTNDITSPDYDILGGQGNYDIGLTIDPNNPQVVYIGGSRDFGPATMIRVDVSRIADSHSLFFDPTRNGGGLLENTTDPISIFDVNTILATTNGPDPLTRPFSNLIRNPGSPFVTGATVQTFDAGRFANTGSGARYTPFQSFLDGFTDIHRMLAMTDPVTGKTRLIIGLDQGVFTGVDDGSGNVISSIGSQDVVGGARNGNLQITQFYNGAAQPSSLAAQIAGALFYGMAQDDGFPQSDPNVLNNGNINWTGSTGDGTGVATDAGGSGTSYFFKWPCCGGGGTNFFSVGLPGAGEVGRTNGLIQTTAGTPPPLGGPSDPQWPSVGGFVFGVNPVNPNAVVLGSGAGRLFGTEDQGLNWFVLADPGTFDGSILPALAYGAPDPSGQGTPGALDNYILVGTAGGHIYVTFTGGGSASGGNAWTNISTGITGGSIIRIVTDPNRGTHDAYATTSGGVFYNADTSAANSTWVNITGNLFNLQFNPFGDPNLVQGQLSSLGSGSLQSGLAADWRYVVPFDPTKPNGASHPLLYVSGVGGVYRSTDNGATWSIFPAMYQSPSNVGLNLSTTAGGNLPISQVTDLSLSLGNVDPTTGRPNVATGPNVLLATTYGRGSFAIRLAPVVFNDAINKPTLTVNAQGQPIINGVSEQTAFGNKVALTIVDVTDPAHPIFLGGYNPAEGTPSGSPSFNVPANETNAFGRFSIQGTYPTPPANNPYLYQGVRQLQIFATDASGTKGNIVPFQITNNPPAPVAPVLSSNHVVTGGTSVTDVTNPTFTVVIPGNNTIPATVTLVRIDSQNNQRTVASTQITGTGSISDPGPVPQGTYTYEVQYQVTVGTLVVTSPLSPPTTVKVVPTITAALLPSDDSGVANDNKTNVTKPHVFGVAPAPLATPSDLTLNLVELAFNGNPITPRILGTTTDPNNGNYVVQFANALPDGTYSIIVQAVDSSGNSLSSRPVSITIKTTAPATSPTLSILATDDTGLANDGKTTVRRPHLVGLTDPGATVNILDAANNVLATTTASTFTLNGHPPGYFSTQLAANLSDGTIPLYAVATDIEGNSTPKPVTPSLNLTIYTVQGDYNGDGKADLAVYRYDPAVVTSAQWNIRNSGSTPTQVLRGWPGHDIPVPGDYTGAGVSLTAVFRPETAQWFIGTPGSPTTIQLGTVGQDIPVPATYDLSGRIDVATYTPATQTWNVLLNISDPANPTNKATAHFGFAATDKPVPGDYTGVGYSELAVYRPGSGQWYVRVPGVGQPLLLTGTAVIGGQPSDVPVPGDYDGIGQTEAAVYRASTGQFIIYNQATHQTEIRPMVFPTGFSSQPGDIPVPEDYDGDGKVDLAVFRPNVDNYFINNSSNGQLVFTQMGFVGHDVAPQGPLPYLVSTIRGGLAPVIPALASASPSAITPSLLIANTTTANVSAASTTMAPAAQKAVVALAAPASGSTVKANALPAVIAATTPQLTVKKAVTPQAKIKPLVAAKPKVMISSHTTLQEAKAHAAAIKHAKTPHDLALAAVGKSHKGRFFS